MALLDCDAEGRVVVRSRSAATAANNIVDAPHDIVFSSIVSCLTETVSVTA